MSIQNWPARHSALCERLLAAKEALDEITDGASLEDIEDRILTLEGAISSADEEAQEKFDEDEEDDEEDDDDATPY